MPKRALPPKTFAQPSSLKTAKDGPPTELAKIDERPPKRKSLPRSAYAP